MFVSFFSVCMYRVFPTSSRVHGVITEALYQLVSVLLKHPWASFYFLIREARCSLTEPVQGGSHKGGITKYSVVFIVKSQHFLA